MVVIWSVVGAVVGGIAGFLAGMVLYIPGCVVATIATNERRGSEIAESLVGPLPILGAVIGIVMAIVEDRKKTAAARKQHEAKVAAEEAEKEATRRHHRERQQGYRQQMVTLGEQSMASFEAMPTHLRTAAEHLDQAEQDFSAGVFAPFWDSVESAARTLGHFEAGVRAIQSHSSTYADLVKRYEAAPPQWPLSPQSVERLTIGAATAERMRGIVRRAQSDFQFAVIYEQRKTNQLLVAGFTNLAQALDQMTWRITTSIESLTSSVEAIGSTINESVQAVHLQLGQMESAASEHRENLSTRHSAQAGREEKVVAMLDNIQRRRRPSSEQPGT